MPIWTKFWASMKIKLEESFQIRFERQLRFIAKDSPGRARQFKGDVIDKIRSLNTNPKRCRRSIFFDDDAIRDLIFKGYVITYRITHDELQVFGFTKYQNDPTDES